MYLTLAEIEATLGVVQARSAAGSRIVIVYHSPAVMLRLLGFVLRRLGEPLRSVFTADAMRTLLERYGFGVVRDDDLPTIAAGLPADIAEATRVMKHLRVVTADRPRETA